MDPLTVPKASPAASVITAPGTSIEGPKAYNNLKPIGPHAPHRRTSTLISWGLRNRSSLVMNSITVPIANPAISTTFSTVIRCRRLENGIAPAFINLIIGSCLQSVPGRLGQAYTEFGEPKAAFVELLALAATWAYFRSFNTTSEG